MSCETRRSALIKCLFWSLLFTWFLLSSTKNGAIVTVVEELY